MLEWYHWTLIGAAALAALSAWHVPRAVFWIAIGAFFYVVSAMWHVYGFPYATAFGAGTNLVVCYLLWIFAEQRYEMRLWNFFHLMLVVDLLYIVGTIRDQITFAITLEVINLVALLFIMLTGIAERVNGLSIRPSDTGWARFVHRALFAERSTNSRPWWQTEK